MNLFVARDFLSRGRKELKEVERKRRTPPVEPKGVRRSTWEANVFRRSCPIFPHSPPTSSSGEHVVPNVPDTFQLIVSVFLQSIFSSQWPSSVCASGPYPYVPIATSMSSLTDNAVLLLFARHYTHTLCQRPRYFSLSPPRRTGRQAYVAIHRCLRGDLLSRFADAGHGRSLCVTSSSVLYTLSNMVLCLRFTHWNISTTDVSSRAMEE